ncbi:sialidase family protein [Rhizocola hellebori]|uniref:sialidase family protein n=1 Tax=Rhizocola hellebori TaxID=1392758 RepID=UPI001940DA8B|nr:sialidase family protein [Rhizocola hellebori]
MAEAPARNVPNELLYDLLQEGEDEGNGEEPNLTALCVDYLGHPNPYGNPAPNVDMIHGDTTVPVGTQTGCQTAQNETSIAVNPFNPRNLVAGANDYRGFNSRENRNDGTGVAYTTMDGGRTWTNVVLPHLTFQTGSSGQLALMDSAGDPALAIGPLNTVYYANIVFSRLEDANGLTVSVSHDGGLHFDEPVIVQLDGVAADGSPVDTDIFNDKEWIAADPFSGTVYLTWTRFDGNVESPIMMKKSTDFGRTWGPAVRVAPSLTGFHGGITPFNQGSIPLVGNDGTLYIAYEASVCATLNCDNPADHDAIVVATSKNGGKTFKNVEVALDFDFPPNEDVGRSTLTGQNFRINSFPQMAYDRVTGRLWVTWADDRNGTYSGGSSVKTNGDNFVVSSTDGRNWSAPVKVGTAADEVYPAVAAFAGRVAVSYYTRVYDPNGIGLDYAMNVGWGNAVASAPIQRITTATQNPQVQFVGVGLETGNTLQGVFTGDYTAIAMGADFQLHPCWTDFRGNPGLNTPNQDAYTQSISAF